MGYGKITKEEFKRREKLLEDGIAVCGHCKRELPIDMFTKETSKKNGLSSFCKDCQREQRVRRKDKIQEWFDNNQDHVKEKQKEYSKTHAQEKREYNQKNKEYFKQKRKEYETNNIEIVQKQRRKNRHSLKARYRKYIIGAKERNLPFELTLEEFDRITKNPCFYCGELPEDEFGNKFVGIDRIDSNEGYTSTNVIPCCFICNRMKSNYDMNYWVNKMRQIINHLQENGIYEFG